MTTLAMMAAPAALLAWAATVLGPLAMSLVDEPDRAGRRSALL